MTSSQHIGSSYCEATCTQEKHIGKIPRSLGLAIANGETWCYLINLCHMKMRSLNCKLRRIINCLQPLQATVEIHTQTACKNKEKLGRSLLSRACPFFSCGYPRSCKTAVPNVWGCCCCLEISKKVCLKCTILGFYPRLNGQQTMAQELS